jgi:hypothetical protein
MSHAILESQQQQRSKPTITSSTKTPGPSNGSLDFAKLVADHRAYFLSKATRPVEWRESQLIALRSMLKDHAEDFTPRCGPICAEIESKPTWSM